VLGLGAVGDVAGAELAELRRDPVEIAERFSSDTSAPRSIVFCRRMSSGNKGPDRGRSREQARVELVHQLLAARSDEVEARFERLEVE
jgi:hypothetical protein